jgi:hypothetical protein
MRVTCTLANNSREKHTDPAQKHHRMAFFPLVLRL